MNVKTKEYTGYVTEPSNVQAWLVPFLIARYRASFLQLLSKSITIYIVTRLELLLIIIKPMCYRSST